MQDPTRQEDAMKNAQKKVLVYSTLTLVLLAVCMTVFLLMRESNPPSPGAPPPNMRAQPPAESPVVPADTSESLDLPESLVMAGSDPNSRLDGKRVNIAKKIQMLRSESLQESLANLHDLKMYGILGGTTPDIFAGTDTLRKSLGPEQVRRMISNRRFLKVLGELSALPEDEASRMLADELASTFEQYKKLFAPFTDEYKGHLAGDSKSGDLTWHMSNNEDGSPTLPGTHDKMMCLLLIASKYPHPEIRELVRQIAVHAVGQRQDFYDKNRYNATARCVLLPELGIYNRQILASALIGTSTDPKPLESAIEARSLKMTELKLTHFDATATTYDYDVDQMPPDYSKGVLTLRVPEALADEDFDAVLAAAGLSQ